MTAILASKSATFQTAMSGFKSESIWLIVLSFFFAKVSVVCVCVCVSTDFACLLLLPRSLCVLGVCALDLVHRFHHLVSLSHAQAFEKTGLGSRIANIFVAAAGKSTLGMSYSLVAAEM